MRYVKPPRERAARALCNLDGNPPDANFEGVPMWKSYVPQVDAVLRVVLGDEVWQEMVEAEKAGAAGSP
ncbi:MAG: hypothetical protein QM656_00560 [Paracoccaceae bacterium]